MTPIIYATTIATGATVTNLPSGITGTWSNNVLTISGTPTVVGTALTYTIALTGGCGVVTTTGTIAVKPKNTIALSSITGTDNQLKCINTAIDNITYNTTGATGANFTGLPVGVSGVWSNDAIVLSGSPSISGSFNYKISLIGGCAIADKLGDINVTPENTITLSSAATTDSQSICIGNNITTIEYTTLGATGFTITGLPTGVQAVFQSNKIKITGTPSVTGVFNYTISLAGGCGQVNKNGTVIINSLPTGTIAASNNGVICEGSNVILTATGGNTYEWNLNNNPISGAVAANYSATVAGLYSVKLISDKGCINFVQQTATLVLNNAPVVGYSFDKYCINTPIVFTNSSTTNLSGPVTMLWDFGDNGISSSTSPTHSFLLEKTYAVKLTITPTNCPLIAKSLSKNIKIEVPPLAIRYPNVCALKNTNTKLTARSIGKTYSWSPSTGLSNASTISPNFNFTTATNYVIKITNDAGCIFNDSLNVLIFDKADFFVPNAFSPNNDGRNDKLLIAAPGIETFQYFRIFNRWGNLVFETSNSSVFWDGTFKGMAQPAEVYSWFAEGISMSGNKIQRNGQTLILR
jgi:gliding motility-associated-like protein